jgi:hypothetical protein
MARRWPTFTEIRATLLFGGGLAGAAYVTLIDQTDRPTLLILFGAMMGLPLFLRSDERHPPPMIQVVPPQIISPNSSAAPQPSPAPPNPGPAP